MEIARGKPREMQRNTKYLAICEQYGLMRGQPKEEGYRRLGLHRRRRPNHYPYMLTKHKGAVKKMGITQLDAPRKPAFNAIPHPPDEQQKPETHQEKMEIRRNPAPRSSAKKAASDGNAPRFYRNIWTS